MNQSETIKQAVEAIRESVATIDGLRGWIKSRNADEALYMESRDLGKVADDLEKMLTNGEHLKTIAVLRRLLPDWHEDAENELRHDGHVIAEITFGDVRAIKALLRELEGDA